MRSDRLYLVDMVEAAEAIETFIRGVDAERFVRDDLLRSAVLPKLTAIGEAAARVSMPLRARFAEVPWSDIVGFRNIAVHAYFAVDWRIVWQGRVVGRSPIAGTDSRYSANCVSRPRSMTTNLRDCKNPPLPGGEGGFYSL